MFQPLCFVLMPFGKKADAAGATIDFDKVYELLIKPAVADAGLDPLRADEEEGGGMIHTPMFERLVLCPYAVADLTTANANVFYELGVRHSARPASTLLLYGGACRLPFDVQPLRALPYQIDATGAPEQIEAGRQAITQRLRQAIDTPHKDSPLYQLLNDYPNVQHDKTDVFRQQVELNRNRREEINAARRARSRSALEEVEKAMGDLRNVEAATLVDLLLAYRGVKAWAAMIALVKHMSEPVAQTVLVQEQLALAVNRQAGEERKLGKYQAAEELSVLAEDTLLDLLERRGPSSETYGILGRVYKDRWQAALAQNDAFGADGALEQAIGAYQRGFEADWRDAYPGVNAVTLMTVHSASEQACARILPVVRYAVEQRISKGRPDYWDWATLLELNVIGRDQKAAIAALKKALPLIREPWEAETTLQNLGMIAAAWQARNVLPDWLPLLQEQLTRKAPP
jgi:tetratricopeptide (TPR) repeat protein